MQRPETQALLAMSDAAREAEERIVNPEGKPLPEGLPPTRRQVKLAREIRRRKIGVTMAVPKGKKRR